MNIENEDVKEPMANESRDAFGTVAVAGQVVIDWEPKEEKRLVLKLDLSLMPLLLLSFFFLCLDRSNISNALTDNLTKDIGIDTDTAAFGNQLQLAGIVISEIPANILLQFFGPQKVLLGEMFAWGFVATFQSFIQNKSQFYATRFLLGTFEGGFIPGAMYLMAMFYKRSETSSRFAVYYFGNYVASGTSSLIAAGILRMDGVHNWSGWRWLFLIDGAMTLGFAVIVLLFLPAGPAKTRPIHRAFDLFNERERHVLQSRISLDQSGHEESATRTSFKEWIKVFGNTRLWLHLLINMIGMTPAGGLLTFAPTIVKALGFQKVQANALVSVGYYGAVLLAFSLSLLARKTGQNGITCILPFVWSCIFTGVLYHLEIEQHHNKWALYAIFTLVLAAMLIVQPINNAWCSKNARSSQERSVGLAMCVVGSNLGGLIGQQLFKSKDAPEYRHGFVAILSIYAAVVVIVVLQILQYMIANQHLDRKHPQRGDEVEEECLDVAPRWRFVL